MEKFVVIVDKSAGNDTVGEMWQETKIYSGDTTLSEVMEWAMNGEITKYSRSCITLTKPHSEKEKNENN